MNRFAGILNAAGPLGCIFVLGYGLVQIYAGLIGIAHHFGSGWAMAALDLMDKDP